MSVVSMGVRHRQAMDRQDRDITVVLVGLSAKVSAQASSVQGVTVSALVPF